MGKLYVLAGRPGNGKTEYLNMLQSNAKETFKVISAFDFASHEDLVRRLYDLVQDDGCQCIAIDDYEVKLIESWREHVVDEEYKKHLSILAGFADNFNVSIIVAVGLKREADKEGMDYYDKRNLRSPVILEEADKIIFIKQGIIDDSEGMSLGPLGSLQYQLWMTQKTDTGKCRGRTNY